MAILRTENGELVAEFESIEGNNENVVDAFLALSEAEFQSMGEAIWTAARAWNLAQVYRLDAPDEAGH